MFIKVKMVILLFILFLGCNVAAKGRSENCDRVQFSFNDQKGINDNQHFTKQSFDKNRKPVYYSSSGPKDQSQTIVWWDNENNTWLSQTMPYSGDRITIKTKLNLPTKTLS